MVRFLLSKVFINSSKLKYALEVWSLKDQSERLVLLVSLGAIYEEYVCIAVIIKYSKSSNIVSTVDAAAKIITKEPILICIIVDTVWGWCKVPVPKLNPNSILLIINLYHCLVQVIICKCTNIKMTLVANVDRYNINEFVERA